jgi:hypothetical protein
MSAVGYSRFITSQLTIRLELETPVYVPRSCHKGDDNQDHTKLSSVAETTPSNTFVGDR